jgi:hypothetical protein
MKSMIRFLFVNLLALSAQAQTPVQFVKAIPSSYNGTSQLPQFAEVSANLTLPTGFVYVKPPTRQGWTTPQVMTKGVTHWIRNGVGEEGGDGVFRNDPAYAKKEYNNVPRIREIFGLPGPVNGNWWPNGYYNEAQARQKANEVSIVPRIWIGETMEGDDYVPESDPMWGWFYDELINRYEAQKAQDGVPYLVAHNYFTRFPSIYQVGLESRAAHESLYNTPYQNWPTTLYHPGQPLGRPNLVIEGIYVNAPDLVSQQMLGALMRMELMLKMGKVSGLFIFNVHEWHPGFASRIDLPEGKFFRSDKIHLDPNVQIALGFLALEFGGVLVEWGLAPHQSPTKKPVDYTPFVHNGKDEWYANGQSSPSPFPFYAQTGPNRFNTGAHLGDFTHFGVALWSATGGQVAGGTPYYATFRLNGGAWIQRQANGSDIVGSYFEQRGLTRVRILGNKMLICYFNFFADNEKHTIEVQNPLNPGQTFTGTVCGNGVHAVVVNL